ncbi:MAG: phosphate signaling complex protein PhoU [Prevotellaceae bacterium]|jgi:phosphate transport system protein|nr:phosphate signaling complex protein PhoU [Prevotellaceae bacterium]
MTTTSKKNELKILLNDFEFMCATALSQMKTAASLLQNPENETLYSEAEANEIILDRLEVKIREEVVFAIFKFTPRAADLRLIITYQDITTNIERVGDILLNIIHSLKRTNFQHKDFVQEKAMIEKMFKLVDEMLRNAVFAFANEDTKISYAVIEKDDEVDECFHQIGKMLEDDFTDKMLDRERIRNIINIKSMSYNLERIGDSATNIAEAAIYLVEGTDIRHTANAECKM